MRRNDDVWTWVLFGLFLLLTGGTAVAVYNQTRGLRNNNPGNIRKSGTQWQGMASVQADPSFVTFTSPEYGIRAIARLLTTYYQSGLRTVEDMISRWAPPSENPTNAYIQNVAKAVGIAPDTPITNLSAALPGLVHGIITQENGLQPYSAALIQKGISLA